MATPVMKTARLIDVLVSHAPDAQSPSKPTMDSIMRTVFRGLVNFFHVQILLLL